MVAFIKSQVARTLKRGLLQNRRAVTWFAHFAVMVAAYVAAYAIRFDGVIPANHFRVMSMTLTVLIPCKLIVFQYYHLHQGVLRYSGMSDLLRLIKATTVSSIIFVAIKGMFFHGFIYPRSVYLLDWLTTIVLFGGIKMSLRLLSEMRGNKSSKYSKNAKKTLIIGAGDAGVMALRELKSNDALSHCVIGFLDDDPRKQGLEINGVPVLGSIDQAPVLINDLKVNEVLIAMPSAGRKVVQQIVDLCADTKINLRILPAISDLITGAISVQAIRNVQVEDLLCRQPVRFDAEQVQLDHRAKTVLVTGAAGSIGSEIARQVALSMPSNLIVLDQAESPIFEILRELRGRFSDVTVTPVIADVKNADQIENVFATFKPQRVYHAAAYKHVPLMEMFPDQAVLNNIRGTRILADAADRHHVERFVLISTDKAVRPGNVMGATKRMCELIVSSMNGNGTKYSAVRFGNVLDSNGSVIPIFKKQIEEGGPLTVTDPQMTRYFMTIPEAVSLVLQCGSMKTSDIYVLDMGTPVKILDLAENMIRLSGLKVGEDIDIQFTGLRPGEKMHEELVSYGEELQKTEVPKINVLNKNSLAIAKDYIRHQILELERLAEQGDSTLIRRVLDGILHLDQKVCENKEHPKNSYHRKMLLDVWGQQAEDGSLPESLCRLYLEKKILVVDDDPDAFHLIQKVTGQLGCSAEHKMFGHCALQYLKENISSIDCVMCDGCMPDLRADNFMKNARECGYAGPIVLTRDCGPCIENKASYDSILPRPFGVNDVQAAFAGLFPAEADSFENAG